MAMSTIKYPGKHDVMLGRGGESNYHSGNIAFRHMVQKYKERFRLGSRSEKNKVIDEVVSEWRNQNPPGRFVAKKNTSTGEVVWYDVGDDQAKKRAAKSLAEWSPQKSFGNSGEQRNTFSASEGKKRSLSSSCDTDSADGSDQEKPSFKRQNSDIVASPVSSLAVVNISSLGLNDQMLLQQQSSQQLVSRENLLQQEMAIQREMATIPVHMPTETDIWNSPAWASPHDIFSTSSSVQPSGATLNQSCICSSDALPLDRIRVALPTAAELAVDDVFSDESGQNSCGSIESQLGSALLPNKLELADSFQGFPSFFLLQLMSPRTKEEGLIQRRS